jgi:hypothetical protein
VCHIFGIHIMTCPEIGLHKKVKMSAETKPLLVLKIKGRLFLRKEEKRQKHQLHSDKYPEEPHIIQTASTLGLRKQ